EKLGQNSAHTGPRVGVDQLKAMVTFGVPTLLCYACVTRPIRFGLAVGFMLLAASYGPSNKDAHLIHRERTFIAVLSVYHYQTDDSYELRHGTTTHGMQIRSGNLEDKPLTYYHEAGPIGQLFETMHKKLAKKDLAFIGLGTGTLAC